MHHIITQLYIIQINILNINYSFGSAYAMMSLVRIITFQRIVILSGTNDAYKAMKTNKK